LNKGWNSRLGFSVGLSPEGQLVISAIYDNSVAAKDGRLQVDDHVLRVSALRHYYLDTISNSAMMCLLIRRSY